MTNRFDRFCRGLASSSSRRELLRWAGGGLAAAALAPLAEGLAEAQSPLSAGGRDSDSDAFSALSAFDICRSFDTRDSSVLPALEGCLDLGAGVEHQLAFLERRGVAGYIADYRLPAALNRLVNAHALLCLDGTVLATSMNEVQVGQNLFQLVPGALLIDETGRAIGLSADAPRLLATRRFLVVENQPSGHVDLLSAAPRRTQSLGPRPVAAIVMTVARSIPFCDRAVDCIMTGLFDAIEPLCGAAELCSDLCQLLTGTLRHLTFRDVCSVLAKVILVLIGDEDEVIVDMVLGAAGCAAGIANCEDQPTVQVPIGPLCQQEATLKEAVKDALCRSSRALSAAGSSEGCSPGDWTRPNAAFPAGLTPTSRFSEAFGVPATVSAFGTRFTDPSLRIALQAEGDRESVLARQAVAALLNAASPAVGFALSPDQVRGIVQTALARGRVLDMATAAVRLAVANERICPLA